ncbi:MAG: YCF48-related protein [Thermoanaerobaculia bacterium]
MQLTAKQTIWTVRRRRVSVVAALCFVALMTPGSSRAGINEWTAGGPDGAAVSALRVHPSNGATVYAGTANGVFRTADGGIHWSAASDGLLDRSVSALEIRPGSNAFYVATSSGRVFTMGGANERWSELARPTEQPIYALGFGQAAGLIYAATDKLVFSSADDGATWSSTALPATLYPRSMAVAPNGHVFLGVSGGVYRSTDGARTFQQAADLPVHQYAVTLDRLTGKLYAASPQNVFRSVDGGQSWQPLPLLKPLTDPNYHRNYCDCSYVKSLVSTPGGLMVTSYDGVVEYIESAGEWKRLGNYARQVSDVVVLDGPPRRVLAATPSGVVVKADEASAWVYSNAGLGGAEIFDLAVDPTDGRKMTAAGSNTIFLTDDSGDTWRAALDLGDHEWRFMAVAIVPLQPQTMFAASDSRIHKTVDGGLTWNSVPPLQDLFPGLALAPSDPATLYVAMSSSMLRSRDGGVTFTSLQGGLPLHYYSFDVQAVAVDPVRSTTVTAGTTSGIYRTVDGGERWSLVSPARVHVLAADPSNSSVIYGAQMSGGILKSIDGGNTWLPSGLEQEKLSTIAIDPAETSTVYAGTNTGRVFRSANGGRTWVALDLGLEGAPVRKLVIDPTGLRLSAVTPQGVYRYQHDRTYLQSAKTYSISLRTYAGNFVSAADCGDGTVNANAATAGACETFTLYDINGGALREGDTLYLQAASGSFLTAENGGGGSVNANRFVASDWETFTIHSMTGAQPITNGAAISLQSIQGSFVAAEKGGARDCACDSAVNANRTSALQWETFALIVH